MKTQLDKDKIDYICELIKKARKQGAASWQIWSYFYVKDAKAIAKHLNIADYKIMFEHQLWNCIFAALGVPSDQNNDFGQPIDQHGEAWKSKPDLTTILKEFECIGSPNKGSRKKKEEEPKPYGNEMTTVICSHCDGDGCEHCDTLGHIYKVKSLEK